MSKPLIICVPHAATSVPEEIKSRLQLTDYDIWRFGDPFTDLTSLHPKAFAIHVGSSNRLVHDPSRPGMPFEKFHTHDFYGNPIYKPGKEFTLEERRMFSEKFAVPYREKIYKSIKSLVEEGHNRILIVDHHNTAGDHPSGPSKKYMPAITFCNNGDSVSGERVGDGYLTADKETIQRMKKAWLRSTGIKAELNDIYASSNTSRWITEEVSPDFPDVKIECVFIEYNLSLIHNPLTRKNDPDAVQK